MIKKINISGRGGCGKSTLTSLIARKLSEENKVVVIDLDEGNLGLNEILGVERPKVEFLDYCGGRDKIMGEILKVGIKGMLMQKVGLKDAESSDSIDVLDSIRISELSNEYTSWNGNIGYMVIGKIEESDEGCACPMGNLARDLINHIELEENEVIIVDTSAGIEHLGRGVTESIDKLITIVDGSNDAVMLANKINGIAKRAGKSHAVILNKVDGSIEELLREKLDDDIEVLGTLEYMPSISESNINGTPIEIDNYDSIDEILSKL